MKVFRDLFIFGDKNQLDETVKAIEESLTGGWSRDREAENRMKGWVGSGDKLRYCFSCTESESRIAAPPAPTFLSQKRRRQLGLEMKAEKAQ